MSASEAAYEPTAGTLEAIAARHGLGRVTGWRKLEGGIVNPVLLLDTAAGQAVLKMNTREPEYPKVAKEAWVLGLVGRAVSGRSALTGTQVGWRVPNVLGVDTSRTVAPYDYFLMEFVSAQGGGDAWEAGDERMRDDLSRQMGRVARELHAVPVSGALYGDWNAALASMGQDEDWREHVARSGAEALKRAGATGALGSELAREVERWLERHLEVAPRRPRRVLLHHDLSLWNALVRPRAVPEGAVGAPDGSEGWEVAAIIDFEWSGVGSAASEFATVMKSAGDCMHPPAFWEAYLDGGRPAAAFAREGTYHTMLYRLTLINVAHKHWGAAAVGRQVDEVKRLLKGASAWAFKDVDGAGLA